MKMTKELDQKRPNFIRILTEKDYPNLTNKEVVKILEYILNDINSGKRHYEADTIQSMISEVQRRFEKPQTEIDEETIMKHELFKLESLYLQCDKCGRKLTDEGSLELAIDMASKWEKLCGKNKVVPRGISGCPNVRCEGELILKSTEPIKMELRQEISRCITILRWVVYKKV